MWQTNGNFFRILFIPNSSRRQLCIFTLFLIYCVQFFLPSFIPKPKKIQYFTRRKHIRSLLSISPNCLYLFCKKLRHRNQTCVNPRLPADSSCQQTKANHVLLSLKELNLFLLPDRLHKAKSSPKKANNQIDFSEGIGALSLSSLLVSNQIFCFWDWPIHCSSVTWKATSGSLRGLHWVISLLSKCKCLHIWMNQCCKPGQILV